MPVTEEAKTAIEAAVDLVNRWNRAVSAGNMAEFAALFAPDAVLFTPVSPDPIHGREAIVQFESDMHVAFPQATLTIRTPVASGGTIAVEWEYAGRNTGPIRTAMRIIPPSGREMHIHGASFIHIHDGLITQERRYYDVRSLFQQLGLQ
jgi:steroid delta-isomerase-like uncharacterized protein